MIYSKLSIIHNKADTNFANIDMRNISKSLGINKQY